MINPFFSILLPTRDRPLLVKLVLLALAQQTYKNFEVILSDNYIKQSCLKVYESFKDRLNIKYVCPRPPLSMAENYNYALSFISGDYVIALEDKSILFQNALLDLTNIIKKEKYEIINFLFDTYLPSDKSLISGRWIPYYNIYPAQEYDSRSLLAKRIKFSSAYASQLPHLKYRNKILVGCWSSNLVNRIKKKHILFQALAPDYTSSALGALYTHTISYDMARPIGLAIQSTVHSNGALTALYSEIAHEFIQESDPIAEYKLYSPFKECTFIQSVILASDFTKIIQQVGVSNQFKVNIDNLSMRAHEEIEKMQDLSENKKAYYKSLIKLPALWKRILSKIHNYFYIRYNPFFIILYLKVNILGRLNVKKYRAILYHRKFIIQNKIQTMPFDVVLSLAGKYYQTLFNSEKIDLI